MKIQVILDLDIDDHGLESVIDHAARAYVENIKRFPHHFDFGQLGTFVAEIERAEIVLPTAINPNSLVLAPEAPRVEVKPLDYHDLPPSELAAALEAFRVGKKSPESPPIDSQGLSDCPYSVGDVLRRILAGGKAEEWTVTEIIGDKMELCSADSIAYPKNVDWRELEASPEWEIYKAADK